MEEQNLNEERITIEPSPEEQDLGLEIMEFMQDMDEIMMMAKRVNNTNLNFDPVLFMLWRANGNTRKT